MRVSRVSMILTSAALAALVLPAQKVGPTTGGTTNGGTTAGSTTGTTGTSSTGNFPGTTTPSATNSTTNPNLTRGAFFFGKVVMPDGTAPPSGVVIERVCNGAARPQAYTDSRGEFSFQVGQTQDMLPDASVERSSDRSLGGMGTGGSLTSSQPKNDAYACDLRANLAGYRSDVINLAGRRNLDDPNVGTLTLHSYAHFEGLTTSATSALAPKDARRAFEKGLEAIKKSKVDEAQDDFLKATGLYARYASAWLELGLVYEKRERFPDARDAYAKSIAADSKFVNPYERLYMLSFAEKNWEDVAKITNQVMHLNPYDFPGSLYYNAVANSQLGKLDIAEKSAREAVQLGATQNPKVHYILGVILAKKQDFKGAAESLKTYLKSDAVTDRDKVAKLLADCEKQVQAKAEIAAQP
jgi:tetratricopeptide (TPR) repeat protein